MSRFIEVLESSRNSVTRDFEYLRNNLGAPLEYCREYNGHRYNPDAPVFELPGFWMNAGELYALLACEQLLEQVQPGLIGGRLLPLKERIRTLLGESGHDADRISQKIDIQPIQVREATQALFEPLAEATLSGKKLSLNYPGRNSTLSGTRVIHPQRLVHYRSNWYLVALCESASGLRLFSIDRIREPRVLVDDCTMVPVSELDEFLSSGFGIFGGSAKNVAKLRFNKGAASWVAEERWHPRQISEWREDAYYLTLPYAETPELVMEILRYGADVEVLSPPELKDEVAAKIKNMHEMYW